MHHARVLMIANIMQWDLQQLSLMEQQKCHEADKTVKKAGS